MIILKIERVEEVALPPGTYAGEWSGYSITIQTADACYRLRTDAGIRGSVKVVVTASEAGIINVER